MTACSPKAYKFTIFPLDYEQPLIFLKDSTAGAQHACRVSSWETIFVRALLSPKKYKGLFVVCFPLALVGNDMI